MTYSSALFEESTSDLTAAQDNKYRRLAEAHRPASPARGVLEIGCGWGGFAEFAAKTYGTSVVGLTISDRAARLCARSASTRRALPKRSRSGFQDYRDEHDQL